MPDVAPFIYHLYLNSHEFYTFMIHIRSIVAAIFTLMYTVSVCATKYFCFCVQIWNVYPWETKYNKRFTDLFPSE